MWRAGGQEVSEVATPTVDNLGYVVDGVLNLRNKPRVFEHFICELLRRGGVVAVSGV